MVGRDTSTVGNIAIHVLAVATSQCNGEYPRTSPKLCCSIQIQSDLRERFFLLQYPQDQTTTISEDLATYFAIAVPINIDIIGPVAADMRS